MEGAIDRLDRMASLLEMQFRMFTLGATLNGMTPKAEVCEASEVDGSASTESVKQRRGSVGGGATALFPSSPKNSPTR